MDCTAGVQRSRSAAAEGKFVDCQARQRAVCLHRAGVLQRTSRRRAGGVSFVRQPCFIGQMTEPTDPTTVAGDDRITGFPALRSWRAVYLFVLAVFTIWIVLLTALSRAYQ